MPGEMREDFQAAMAELQQTPEETTQGTEQPSAPAAERTEQPASGGDSRQRDERGRFAPRTDSQNTLPQTPEQTTQAPEAQAAQGQPQSQAPAPPQALRAPVSWTPEEREHWGTMTPHQQQAVLRREQEINTALRTTAEARQFWNDFQRTVQPYELFLRAENASPLEAVGELFRMAAVLRTAPPGQKAQAIADICMQYSVDLQALDGALSARLNGRAAPQNQIQSYIDQALRPILDEFGRTQAQRTQANQRTQQEVVQQLEDFLADPVNEFAWDVREDMADILELEARRGRTISLQDAYKRATLAHPTVSGILQQRSRASQASQQTAAARRAQEAAASLPPGGAPSQGNDEDDGSIRSAVVASIRQHAQSR